MNSLSEKLSQPEIDDLGEPQQLESLFPEENALSLQYWQGIRQTLTGRWRTVIGKPSFGEFDRTSEVIDSFEMTDFKGTVILQPTGPSQRQKLFLMEPKNVPRSPRPGALVPFYDPDRMAGIDLKTREDISESTVIQFGRHLVKQGYVVVCPEAFPYNTVPEPASSEGFAWWQAGTDKILADNPGWTGIGKLTWDTSRAVDLLLDQPGIDAERILAIGHSLGGKMAFYTAAFDERITAVIASDFGIGWSFTNWDADWYFGTQIQDEDFTLNGHHALALIAPRSFLLIAGEADRPESWQHINEARQIYRLHKKENAVGCFMHMEGHTPTEDSMYAAYKWLAEQFSL
jgi:predicted esterase